MTEDAPAARPGQVRFAHAVIPFSFQDNVFQAALHYREDDPFAVLLKVNPDDDDKDWRLARSLLTDALAYRIPAQGDRLDVIAERRGRDGEVFDVLLAASRPGPSLLTFRTSDVQDFLRLTVALVPLGAESAAIDWTAAEKALGLAPGSLSDGAAA